jgi:glycosyltransferase involved in cell wall biosynthesis
MKVGYVSTLQPDTNYFRYLALALQERGVDLRVYADRNPKNLDVGLKKVHLLWSPGDRLYPLHILRQALRDRPDVVHLHHEVGLFGGPINASIFPFVPFLLWLFGCRVVTTIHAVVKPALIDLHFLETFAWPPRKFLLWPVKIYFFLLYWSIVLFSRKVIVHAKLLKEELVGDYRCPSEKITVVPHGVPEEVEHPPLLTGETGWGKKLEGQPFLLYFGYLHRRKGLETLLESWVEVIKAQAGVKLVLAGGTLQPDYGQSLAKRVTALGLAEHVVLTGFVTQKQLRYLLDRCLFVVLPATYSIAASGPLAQVIAHEKPVIVTRVGVFGEEIREGENGLLARLNDSQDWARQILKLWRDRELLEKLQEGMKVLHRVRGWPPVAALTVKVYEEALR